MLPWSFGEPQQPPDKWKTLLCQAAVWLCCSNHGDCVAAKFWAINLKGEWHSFLFGNHTIELVKGLLNLNLEIIFYKIYIQSEANAQGSLQGLVTNSIGYYGHSKQRLSYLPATLDCILIVGRVYARPWQCALGKATPNYIPQNLKI